MTSPITVSAEINAPIDKVWKLWTLPEHIMQWCHASDDWEAPHATNDVRVGGTFVTTMSAKDKSVSFDFGGTYTEVEHEEKLAYTLGDGRQVMITFESQGNSTRIVENFEPEHENSRELQQAGWQSILNTFKKYVEAS